MTAAVVAREGFRQDRMMRVAFYAATLMEIGGGLGKRFFETARDLSELDGDRVDMCTMDDRSNLPYGQLHKGVGQ